MTTRLLDLRFVAWAQIENDRMTQIWLKHAAVAMLQKQSASHSVIGGEFCPNPERGWIWLCSFDHQDQLILRRCMNQWTLQKGKDTTAAWNSFWFHPTQEPQAILRWSQLELVVRTVFHCWYLQETGWRCWWFLHVWQVWHVRVSFLGIDEEQGVTFLGQVEKVQTYANLLLRIARFHFLRV